MFDPALAGQAATAFLIVACIPLLLATLFVKGSKSKEVVRD